MRLYESGIYSLHNSRSALINEMVGRYAASKSNHTYITSKNTIKAISMGEFARGPIFLLILGSIFAFSILIFELNTKYLTKNKYQNNKNNFIYFPKSHQMLRRRDKNLILFNKYFG